MDLEKVTSFVNLLHEGTGPRVISAYVEIIFDNTDNRIPIEKPEVSLRRIIGNKKDQYFLDKKMVTKADVVNLFESAGFSRSNPYYIVKQGKITQLATSPDSQRLKLLREVAGTRVYDERKEESKLILKESEGRMEKIQEFLNQIEERLRNLESETKELKEYQRWDRDRRALEYTIHDRELKETTKKLEELQRKRETSSGSATKVRAMAKECADEVERLDKLLREKKIAEQRAMDEREQLAADNADVVKRQQQLQLTVSDLRAQLTGDTSQRSRAQEELRQVRKSCEDAELKLQQLRPQYEEARRKEEGAANQLSDAEHRRKELYAKQGRGNQFQTTIASCEKELVELKGDLDHGGEDVRLLRRRKEELHAERQAVYREELGLQQQLNSLREELSRCDQSLRARTGKGILSGIDSVRQLFDVDDTFYTCVEVTAGTRLFYHVVGHDRHVIQILKQIDKKKLPGDINFFPMNRIEVHDIEYPKSQDAVSMMSKIEFKPQFRNVLEHVFGKTLICRSLEVATRLARQQRFDCILLEGDQVSRKGTLTGGYFDTRFSKLELQKNKQKTEAEYKELEQRKETNRLRKEELDKEVNSKINELEKRETARSKYEMNYDRRKTLLNRAREELRNVKEGQPNKEWKLGSLKHELEQMKSTRESYQAELGSDLLSQLSVEEQREVDSLNDRIQELTREAKQLYNARIRLENEKTTIENQLHHNLLRRREQLETQLDEVAAETVKERLTEAEEELAEIENRVAAFQREMQSEEDRIARFGQSIDDLHQRIEAKKAEEKEHLDKISDDQTSLEKMQTKQSQLLAKKEECMKKIRELGSLPADAFDKFQDKSSKQLFKSLERANREIKNYAHVNKKALDQFLSSSEEKEKLLKGKEELDEALKSIQDLMVTLEHRKYEAIQFTFKQVSKYFKEIFSKLVPEGVAELVMQKGDAPAADDSGEPVDQVTSEMQRFVGIGIRVSFTGKTADMKDMNQLSGGQKSLVALTLIFAIQKCDPAPFYLFDEIDAALDAAHRRSVSAMIKELSQEAQFISTTFRPELLDSADKFYGVKFRNKVSHIECVTKEEALDFVEDDQTHS
uniref:SMC hinge domain-containing protein n=1 Tax=Macrostomum lignano TaxID=282301 RepID=A0A1I8GD47_9PLAT